MEAACEELAAIAPVSSSTSSGFHVTPWGESPQVVDWEQRHWGWGQQSLRLPDREAKRKGVLGLYPLAPLQALPKPAQLSLSQGEINI